MVLNDGGASGPEDKAATTDTSTDPLGDAINAVLDGKTQESAPAVTTGGAKEQGTSTVPQEKSEEAQPSTEVKPDSDQGKAVPKDNADAEAPQHWPADRREAFAKLPADGRGIVQAFVKDLTGGYTRKMQEVGDDVRFAKGVRSLFTDEHRQQMQKDGVDEASALRNLVQLHDFASKQPLEYVKWAMQRFGVTIDHLAPKKPDQQQEQPDPLKDLLADPEVKTLKSELAELRKWRDERVAGETRYAESQVQARAQAYQNMLEGFRSTQDDHGQLKYPHFERVGRAMGALMDTHPELVRMRDGPEKLEAAYDMAVNADPELRKPLFKSEVDRLLAEERKAAEAEKAKRAGGIRPASGAPTSRPGATNLNSAIDQAMSQLGI